MDWHERYVQQARWTRQLRNYLFKKASLDSAERVLEVGCGTGAVLEGLPISTSVHGLDMDMSALKEASYHAPRACLIAGSAINLPFAKATFDLAYCHFLLLWVKDPFQAVCEMRRVVKPGGAIVALAEPDYGGRIDYPIELAETGQWQMESIRRQGADPQMGRKLTGLFCKAGVLRVETGVLGGEWRPGEVNEDHMLEWQVLMEDLAGKVPMENLQEMKEMEMKAYERGERILFVPTFYAWGIV